MNVTLWSGVKVDMQSAIGAAIQITALSKASPGVASAAAHGLANGDIILLKEVQGMVQVNNRVFRVAASNAGTFALEGEDTTLYNTFISGNAYKITLGASFTTLLDIQASGGESSDITTTTIHDEDGTSIPGITSPTVFASNSIWDVADPGLIAAKKASTLKAQRVFMFTYQNGQKFLINGYVSAPLNPAGSAQEKVTTPLKITAAGSSTTYAS